MANPLGATPLGGGRTHFTVWAPSVESVGVHVLTPHDRLHALTRREDGVHEATLEGVGPGARYFFRLDDRVERPDPASRFQPEGVHGASQVMDLAFRWSDAGFRNPRLQDHVFYELHIGTFTPEGTFDAAIEQLGALAALGVTGVEVMPVAPCPGKRNWGYDGVGAFAVHEALGGPAAFARFVDACHGHGLACVLDVVYNHVGPEGNYLGDFGPYFTDRYRTPWGAALNFDGENSDPVRNYFVESALQWVRDYHVDALRLDAVHAIVDTAARTFLEDLEEAVSETAARLGRRVHLIAESDANDSRLVRRRELGGVGLDAVWNDDFHHALHTLLTAERSAYYEGYGHLEDLARAWRDGFIYTGQRAPHRRRRHGSSAAGIPPERFVVCAQNHDQIGNRPLGERLIQLAGFESAKLAAGLVLLSPFVPLLFMGEEYGEKAPFLYFVDHGDPGLVAAVRKGRHEEFAAFFGQDGESPDPQAEATFLRSKLDRSLAQAGEHRALLELHRELLALRRSRSTGLQDVLALERSNVLFVRRGNEALAFHFGVAPVEAVLPLPRGAWASVCTSAAERWRGPGCAVPEAITSEGEVRLGLSPRSFVLLRRREE